MKRAPNQPETISLTIYAGIYYRVYRIPDADTLIPQHGHELRASDGPIAGRVRLWREGDDDGPTEYCAPATIRIPAHVMHSFLTLTPGVVLACIHNADHLEADEPAVAAHHNLNWRIEHCPLLSAAAGMGAAAGNCRRRHASERHQVWRSRRPMLRSSRASPRPPTSYSHGPRPVSRRCRRRRICWG